MGSIKLATSILLIFVASWKINGESLTDADVKYDDVFQETKVSYPFSFLSQRETQVGNFRQQQRNVNKRSNKKITNRQWEGHGVTCISSCGPSLCSPPWPQSPGSKSGTIQSRWYPLDYGTNLDCLYTIRVNKPGCTLALSFVDFVVEENFDFVTVSTPLVSYPKFTGYSPLPPVTTTTGLQMTVRFTADCSNCKIPTGYGRWKANYQLICPIKPEGLPAQKKKFNRSLVRGKTN